MAEITPLKILLSEPVNMAQWQLNSGTGLAPTWHFCLVPVAIFAGVRWVQFMKKVSVTCHIKSMSHSLPVRFLKMLASQEKAVIEKKNRLIGQKQSLWYNASLPDHREVQLFDF